MARNKHPEETVNLILDVAARPCSSRESFRQYQHSGHHHRWAGRLDEGAVYHHFKSKETSYRLRSTATTSAVRRASPASATTAA